MEMNGSRDAYVLTIDNKNFNRDYNFLKLIITWRVNVPHLFMYSRQKKQTKSQM